MADELAIKLQVGDKTYSIELSDITGIEDRDFRRATGHTIPQAFTMAGTNELVLEPIAGIVWLIRRRDEPDLKYEEVLGGLTYGDLLNQGSEEGEADPPTE